MISLYVNGFSMRKQCSLQQDKQLWSEEGVRMKWKKITFMHSKREVYCSVGRNWTEETGIISDSFYQFWKSIRSINRISYFYKDSCINTETWELEGHQLSAVPLQWFCLRMSGWGIRWQWLPVSPQMNLAVVILPSADWKLLSQRHCRAYKQSNGTKTTPFSHPTLSSLPHVRAGSV